MLDSNLKRLLILAVIVKLCMVMLIYMGFYFFPFAILCHQNNFHTPENEIFTRATTYKTWDAQHYIYLAEKGYTPGSESDRFFPLYPFIIKLFNPLFMNNTVITGLAVSNVLSLMVIALFYMFVKRIFDEKIAYSASLFLLAFPTSFFLNLIYAESLLMALSLMFFYCLYTKKYALAFMASVLLPLSRPQGSVVVVALLVYILMSLMKEKKQYKDLTKDLILFVGFTIGLAAYFISMKIMTGSFLFGLNQHLLANKGNHSIWNLFQPSKWLFDNFINVNYTLHNFTNSIIDRLFFVFFAAVAFFSYRRINRTMFTYLLLIGLLPIMTGNFLSYSRYLLQAYPMFITLALVTGENNVFLLVPMIVLQTFFVVAHSLNFWIG